MKLQYDSQGYIKSYVVETDRRKEINTFKIENNNIVEKYTETFYDGNLRSSETLKLEYDNNFNKNPLSLLHFLNINSMFFMDGYFGKSSKNNLIKAFYIESKNSGNSDKPTIVSIEFNFDDLKKRRKSFL